MNTGLHFPIRSGGAPPAPHSPGSPAARGHQPRYIAGGAKPKKKYKNSGILKVLAFEELPAEAAPGAYVASSALKMELKASNLDKKDKGPFALSDPYYIITREPAVPEVRKSEIVMKSLDPEWTPFEISALKFCGGDDTNVITIHVWDWDRVSKHDLIGSTTLTVGALKQGQKNFDLVNPKYLKGGKKPKKNYANSGVLTFTQFEAVTSTEDASEELDSLVPNPFESTPEPHINLSLAKWWSELGNKGASWKLKAAARWLTSDFTGGAWKWAEGDFIACANVNALPAAHGPLWRKITKAEFEAGSILWPSDLCPDPAKATWFEFRYYRKGAVRWESFSDFYFPAPAPPDTGDSTMTVMERLGGMDLDLDRNVSSAEFLLIGSFLDMPSAEAKGLFEKVSRKSGVAVVQTASGPAIPLGSFVPALGLIIDDVDGIAALAAAIKKAEEFWKANAHLQPTPAPPPAPAPPPTPAPAPTPAAGGGGQPAAGAGGAEDADSDSDLEKDVSTPLPPVTVEGFPAGARDVDGNTVWGMYDSAHLAIEHLDGGEFLCKVRETDRKQRDTALSKMFQPDDGSTHKFTFVTHKWDNSNVGLVTDDIARLDRPPHSVGANALTLVYSKTGADAGVYGQDGGKIKVPGALVANPTSPMASGTITVGASSYTAHTESGDTEVLMANVKNSNLDDINGLYKVTTLRSHKGKSPTYVHTKNPSIVMMRHRGRYRRGVRNVDEWVIVDMGSARDRFPHKGGVVYYKAPVATDGQDGPTDAPPAGGWQSVHGTDASNEVWPYCRAGDVITIEVGDKGTGAISCVVKKNGNDIARYPNLRALGLQPGAKMMAYTCIDSEGESVALKYQRTPPAAKEAPAPPPPKKKKGMTPALKGALARLTSTCKRRGMKAPYTQAWQLLEDPTVNLSATDRSSIIEEYEDGKDAFSAMVQEMAVNPPALNSSSGKATCEARCKAEVEAIVARCNAAGTKYTDPDFNPDTPEGIANMTYVTKKEGGYDWSMQGYTDKWMRISEFFDGSDKRRPKAVLFDDGISAGDIGQGTIGTCWILGAIGTIAGNKPERIEDLFVAYDIDVGVYGIRFNVDCEWMYLILDDHLAMNPKSMEPGYVKQLAYSKNPKEPNEVWVPLLEKAFAKLYSSWEAVDGGQAKEAIQCLFGGVTDELAITQRTTAETLWEEMNTRSLRGELMGASFKISDAMKGKGGGLNGEDMAEEGLVSGHAYSIIKAIKVDGILLIQFRNPWGHHEWEGKYSDKNSNGEWTDSLKAACGYVLKNGGGMFVGWFSFLISLGSPHARPMGRAWGTRAGSQTKSN